MFWTSQRTDTEGSTFASAFRGTAGGQLDPEDEEADRRAARYRDLREDARRLAREGDPNEGTRTLLLSLLALLSEEQVVAVARSWTPRETLERVASRARANHAALETFRAAVETALYGTRAVTQDDFADCERILDELVGPLRRSNR